MLQLLDERATGRRRPGQRRERKGETMRAGFQMLLNI
jgi:hypothetical protein